MSPAIISVVQLHALLQLSNSLSSFALLDVREIEAHQAGYITASVSLHTPLATIKYFALDVLKDIAKDKHIICYCNSGRRSMIAALYLQEAGYTHISSLNGGYQAWRQYLTQSQSPRG